MALHVDDCPLRKREYNGKFYANVIDDCSGCPHFHGVEQPDDPESDKPGHVRCDIGEDFVVRL